MGSARFSSGDVPPVPAHCPHNREDEAFAARAAAVVDMMSAESAERVAKARRRDADASLLHYENLLAELSGQGSLEIA